MRLPLLVWLQSRQQQLLLLLPLLRPKLQGSL